MPRNLCGMDVAYPRLSNWTCLQWRLRSWHMHGMSAFSAMRRSDALFPNDFGEDLFHVLCCYTFSDKEWTITGYEDSKMSNAVETIKIPEKANPHNR